MEADVEAVVVLQAVEGRLQQISGNERQCPAGFTGKMLMVMVDGEMPSSRL